MNVCGMCVFTDAFLSMLLSTIYLPVDLTMCVCFMHTYSVIISSFTTLYTKVPARIMRHSQAQVLYGIKGSKQSSQIKSCLVIFFSSIFYLVIFLFLDSKMRCV